MVTSRVAKRRRNALQKLVSFLARSQIWLNVPMDDRHFGYITKLTPKRKSLLA